MQNFACGLNSMNLTELVDQIKDMPITHAIVDVYHKVRYNFKCGIILVTIVQ